MLRAPSTPAIVTDGDLAAIDAYWDQSAYEAVLALEQADRERLG